MCFFPYSNVNISGRAFKKGVTSFECGACPECLNKRSSRIMLRDIYEAKSHALNCMLTLTYDTYVRDDHGKIIGEVVSDKKVNVRDCQLFLKRLRVYLSRNYGIKIKYRLSAEYGKKTHRPHYHCLIFGWSPPDCVYYKKTKRGSIIYTSHIISRLWRNGICTVDAKYITPAIARYCSKYTSKDHGVEDTFSLCSQGIGVESLLHDFNGLYYVVEGRKYPIPRKIWEIYITDCYAGRYHFTAKYVNLDKENPDFKSFFRNQRLRRAYQIIRDHDPLYRAYLEFWRMEANRFNLDKPPVFSRILALSNDKYFFYKQKALEVFAFRKKNIPMTAPRSGCVSHYNDYLCKCEFYRWRARKALSRVITCPFPSRLNRASDTISPRDIIIESFRGKIRDDTGTPFASDPEFYPIQLNFFNDFS